MTDSFNTKAADWDSPEKISMTKKFVTEMLMNIDPQPNWKAMEIGAGTGLVGLQIEHLVQNILMVDTSASMLDVLKQKLTEDSKVEVIHGEVVDYKEQDIDFVFSCMAFHHIPDIEKTVQHLAEITKEGAWVVIGDLVTEDGSFHNFEPIPHCGFNTAAMSSQFLKAGFEIVLVKNYNTMSRETVKGSLHFEQFILIAKRNFNI